MVLFAMFLVGAVAGVVFNFKYSDTGLAIGSEELLGAHSFEETPADDKRRTSNEDARAPV